MSWAALDDAFPENGKVADLSDAAFRADVSGICYAARNLTDGYIPLAIAKKIAGRPRVLSELVPGLWHLASDLCKRCKVRPEAFEACATGTGYYIHDYLDYNPTRAFVEAQRLSLSEKRAAAGRKGAEKRWQTPWQTDSKEGGKPIANGMANPIANEWQSDGPLPHPLPRTGSTDDRSTRTKPPRVVKAARESVAADVLDELVALWARFGECNEYTADAIADAIVSFTADWVERAIKVAGKSATGRPKWSFVESVLRRWQKRGAPDDDELPAPRRSNLRQGSRAVTPDERERDQQRARALRASPS